MTVCELLSPEKKYLKGKKALIFDMDGTLIDSMQYWHCTAGDDLSGYSDHIAYMAEKYKNSIQPKPDAFEFLSFLKENGIPTAIATDTPFALSKGFTEKYDLLSLVDCYVGSDDVGTYKQISSDIYLYAASLLGVSPDECVVFEDTLTSVKSALNAGMTVVGVDDRENVRDREEIKSICADFIYGMKEMMKR